jgi:hypothetical protein
LRNEAKREAQEALFTAIKDQAETNMRAALRATEKAQLLRDLAEAYRLAAGGSVPDMPSRNGASAASPARKGSSSDDGASKE